MKSSDRKKVIKLILMWMVSIGVLGLAYFVVVFPIHHAVAGKSQKVSQMHSEVKRMHTYISDENYNRLTEQEKLLCETLDSFVASSKMAGESAYSIADVAANVGVGNFTTKQKTMKGFSQIQNCQFLTKSIVEISCTGSYIEFLQLANEYERSQPVVLIDKFTFTVNQNGQNGIKMSLLILVNKNSKPI